MSRDEIVKQGAADFYRILKSNPLTLQERVAEIRLHEEFGYHNDTYLYLDIVGESGRCQWRYPGAAINYPVEKLQAIGEYLSDLFSCPFKVKLFPY